MTFAFGLLPEICLLWLAAISC